jgi:gamma-glutamyltranspeptidase/glutathione hydrolase
MGSDLDRFESRRSTVYGQRGVVATSQPLAAQAGISTLESSGNAFDAAVATAAALNVVEPTSTGLGGDVFALYRTAEGDVGAMRACGAAPAAANIDTVREALEYDDDETAEMPATGAHTVTVPGTARGWEAIVDRFGQKSLATLLQPAIEYALDGYPVSEVVAEQWRHGEELFDTPHARAAYLFDGAAPDPGQLVRLPELGESLQAIAREGADVVYEGEIAEQIVTAVQSEGGLLTRADLVDFEVEWPDPITSTYNGAEIYELPPNNQGVIVLEALNIAGEIGAGDHPLDSPERVHYFVEAMKRAFYDGHHYITDPEFEEHPPLSTMDWARRRAQSIGAQASDDISIGVPNANAEDADTVLLTVADDDGNLVSFINSRFKGFGSGLVVGETGIALQNRGASFSLNPEHPNALEPSKRPFHTLIPAIVKMGHDDWMAFGVMGGYMQPQGHVQVLSNIIDYDLSLQAALDRPRWRYRESGVLALEPHVSDDTAVKLARLGHDIRIQPATEFGGAQIVRSDASGVLSAATEPRKDGNAQGY